MEYIYHSKPTIDKEDLRVALECMVSDYIGPGNLVIEFEKKLSNILAKTYSIATYSGTISLFLILKSLNIAKGDSVLVPAYSPSYVINSLSYLSIKPILVDINEDYSINTDDIDKKIDKKVKAIILVPLFGVPIDVKVYKKYNLPIIYNATQVLGSYYDNIPAGKDADFVYLSFYATKMITTGGLGGAILTDNKLYYEKIKNLIARDPNKNYPTYPFLMSDLQASMGIAQLNRLDEFIDVRRNIANFYNENFKPRGIIIPPSFPNRKLSFFRYILKIKEIEKVIKLVKEHNIELKRPVESPLYTYLGENPEDFPVSHLAYIQNLSIPIYPTLSNQQVKKIVKVVSNIIS
ncbi:MAG TPA: DegT/DnrJ/EryC1/StrS aminotransferase family protein [Spirochaetota bacterium]|nr:DegT/DnrJ/EryC1/StrS aminotransferase family protein [Spirochaetota bacterium]HOM38970.1 DegT/DnrJ/EryC1/StrS aminotransferase family protein [Spirochaetota bacterium]HPQ48370.1 DegT/DnrJ/EryC1/StrS aminotransferase family protein [Spirochaetota bacterium]